MRIKKLAVLAAAALIGGLLSTTPAASAEATLTGQKQLGKSLFFDRDLSLNKNQSCATCHAPGAGWTGPDGTFNAAGAVYEGSIAGAFGDRKPPSASYATQSPLLSVDKKGTFSGGMFWDGRATGETLASPTAEQAQGPFLNPAEQALPDSACVIFRAHTSAYGASFDAVVGPGVGAITWPADMDTLCSTAGAKILLSDADRGFVKAAYDQVGYAIAAYEGSKEVNAFSSKFDATFGGPAKLTALEQQGFALFQGKGGCKVCHTSSGKRPLFTDFTFDNLGIPSNPENPANLKNPSFVDPGLGGYLATRADYAGYAEQTWGAHKVPTLRNVALGQDQFVKACGHNGYFKSLYGIVHFYNTRDVLARCPGPYTEAEALAANCWLAPEVAENVNTDELGNLGLTRAEELAIVAFMEALSDGWTP